MFYYRFVYNDQPQSKKWHQSLALNFDDTLAMLADMWNHYTANLSGLEIGDGLETIGIIQVDEAGRLVFRRGTDVRILRREGVRKPQPLNLLPPEMRKPQ